MQTISFATRGKSRANFGFGKRYGYYLVRYRAGFLNFDFFGILWALEGRILAISRFSPQIHDFHADKIPKNLKFKNPAL